MTEPFDSKKDRQNITKHGVSLDVIHGLDWSSSITRVDDRRDYGEDRFITYAMLANRLHVLVWTPRDGTERPISFRKANKRERNFYAKKIKA